jgi:hypothetical protein
LPELRERQRGEKDNDLLRQDEQEVVDSRMSALAIKALITS